MIKVLKYEKRVEKVTRDKKNPNPTKTKQDENKADYQEKNTQP